MYWEYHRKNRGREEIFEVIMAENLTKLMTVTKPQINEVKTIG